MSRLRTLGHGCSAFLSRKQLVLAFVRFARWAYERDIFYVGGNYALLDVNVAYESALRLKLNHALSGNPLSPL